MKTKQTGAVKELNPREPDTKYYGDEPLFALQPDGDYRQAALIRGFRWYNRYYGRKDAKALLAEYLDIHDRAKEAKILRRVEDSELLLSFCWLARMSLRGLELTDHEAHSLEHEIVRLLKTTLKPEGAVTPDNNLEGEAEEAVKKPNIQDIMREKAAEAAGELEGLLDEYVALGAATKHSIRPIDTLAKANILAQHIGAIVTVWNEKIAEYEEAARGTDEQLTEGYSNFTKTQLKNLVKFCELVIADLNGYANIKKANKTPRKKKAVPVSKIVSKLKYLKEFAEFNLKSVPAVQVHGASEIWLYDTAKRKVQYYVADSHSQTMTVKGNTLIGFDPVMSMSKTLRKPAEQLRELMKAGKPAARKWLKDVKTVQTELTGRFNDKLVILKAY